jgi:hypothetical protein
VVETETKAFTRHHRHRKAFQNQFNEFFDLAPEPGRPATHVA